MLSCTHYCHFLPCYCTKNRRSESDLKNEKEQENNCAGINKKFYRRALHVPLQTLLGSSKHGPIFTKCFITSQAKSHLSVIHEMRNYPFRVLHCELKYMDLKLQRRLSYLVLCNALNPLDVAGEAK